MRTMGKNSPDIADLVESQSALINQKNLALQMIETSKQAKDKAEAKLDQMGSSRWVPLARLCVTVP